MKRRDALKSALALGVGAVALPVLASENKTDGTPMQFVPRTPPDVQPLKDELKKYPKCPYCGMDRSQFHHSRHLVQYADDLVDGTCSIHCLAISLSLNIDREPKAIWGADFGSAEAVKPMLEVDRATYLIGSDLPGVMTGRSKKAFASPEAAAAAQAKHGGETGDFNQALLAAYTDMARDTVAIRKRREERRRRTMENKG
ncbi:MAG: nitrous oxide reductase accessory protein NosL [Gallionellaceae bacterium]|nr:nitrous oxide reductase accessory protein NosL [Gallionellaceae bacterium]